MGDLRGNCTRILQSCQLAARESAALVVFPEMAITGYPVEDLALRDSFANAALAASEQLARQLYADGLGALPVVVGSLSPGVTAPRNVAHVLRHGVIEATYVKHHLPNYGVFDERRIFEPGDVPCVIEVAGAKVSLAICEDLWYPDSPAQLAAQTQRVDLVAVLNASPFERGKHHTRLELCAQRAVQFDAALAYVAAVGGQDELVFDGGSMVLDRSGRLLGRSERFVEDLLIVETGAATPVQPDELTDLAEVYEALTLGLADYVAKNGMSSVTLGLSGGIDSALVAAIACDAIGAENVFGVAMPSKYSSDHSLADAADLAKRTGLNYRTIPIAKMFDAYQSELGLTGLAEENIQARIRGTTLMAISNSDGHLVLATGNKSELAVGYSTIYGDAVGGFAPIKDVPKTLVWELARWRNQRAIEREQTPPIPPNSIEKEPSAELRPDQRDTDSLPEYQQLDEIVERYVEARVSAADLAAAGFDAALAERILQMVDAAEYKRRQYPPGTKITRLAFGRDRRIPITNRWRETVASDERA